MINNLKTLSSFIEKNPAIIGLIQRLNLRMENDENGENISIKFIDENTGEILTENFFTQNKSLLNNQKSKKMEKKKVDFSQYKEVTPKTETTENFYRKLKIDTGDSFEFIFHKKGKPDASKFDGDVLMFEGLPEGGKKGQLYYLPLWKIFQDYEFVEGKQYAILYEGRKPIEGGDSTFHDVKIFAK